MKRYEKKYSFIPTCADSLELSLVEQGFISEYEPRLITSFYYDSCDFSLYSDSIHGNGSRHKFRARFYNLNNNCTLEDKVRAFDTGYKLNGDRLILSDSWCSVSYSDNTDLKYATMHIPESINTIYTPKVVVTYFRKYFVSSIKADLRITLDSNIRHGRILNIYAGAKRFAAEISAFASRNVLEVKHSSSKEQFSSIGVSAFAAINLVSERHSKYCNAVAALY